MSSSLNRKSHRKLHQKDIAHIWHPYTDITAFEKREFPIVERAEGNRIYDIDGKSYLDAIASWWCVNLGHSHPRLVAAIQEQASKVQHVILGGMSHENAILLAERIAQITPNGLRHSFFASDGASAVEASLRMAIQYWYIKGESGRTKFVGLTDGYHGDTLGAVGVGYVEAFHKELKNIVQNNFRAASPHCAKCPYQKHPASCDAECFASMEEIVEKHHQEIAAVILEPICQGAAGVRIYSDKYVTKVRALCDRYNLLMIADEIAVGFGRTGSMFACQKAGVSPDIMTIGKGVTSGYLPLSASVANDRVYDAFRDGNTLFHGHTYCGNPLATAVALAALDVYEEMDILTHIQPKIALMAERTAELAKLLPGSFFNHVGMISMFEVLAADGGATRAAAIGDHALKNGIMIRPLGTSVYLWPPLVSSIDELNEMFDALVNAISAT